MDPLLLLLLALNIHKQLPLETLLDEMEDLSKVGSLVAAIHN
jgi:hypothetical protein